MTLGTLSRRHAIEINPIQSEHFNCVKAQQGRGNSDFMERRNEREERAQWTAMYADTKDSFPSPKN